MPPEAGGIITNREDLMGGLNSSANTRHWPSIYMAVTTRRASARALVLSYASFKTANAGNRDADCLNVFHFPEPFSVTVGTL
jgi:hypothetical protein